ncbi:MAG: DNA polymerase/3'-5' exonuclease PolX, partial [Chloroflexi bacterium]|nr:DNA polymerase/3'-5' exonuclease PolX [Chloroflexota bacterium]
RTIEDLPRSAAELIASGEDLAELPGIGADLAGKIAEFVDTKHLAVLDEAKARLPAGLVELTNVPGIGPKRARALYDKLKVHSVADLKKAATAGNLHGLAGFGVKSEAKLLEELKRRREVPRRFRLDTAEDFAEPLLEHLKRCKGVVQAIIAGSYRRRKETVGDLDILVAARAGSDVMQRFVSYDEVDEVAAQGETRATVVLRSGLQVDLRVVPEESYGAALHYFTGSKAHNIAVRTLGLERGLKINEYGVFRGAKRVAGETEESVYDQVRLPFIPPELREDRGEIAAAAAHKLPKLVELKDIRGDLHVHTDASDGTATLRQMAEAARSLGYEYVAITDHSKHVTIANGLDARRLARQIKAIDKLNSQLERIRVLKGIEVDILADGSLDLPDAILADLDFTVCAIHYKFDLEEAEQTERVVRAMDNPHFNIFAHPTGRLLGERAAYAIDLERILKAAKERGCCIELNAHPMRLDIDDHFCRLAKDMGVKVALGTDAHSIDGLQFMKYGIGQARRGWLEPKDVLNTRPLHELAKLFARR